METNLRYLVGYNSSREGLCDYYESYFACLQKAGYDVECFCITLDPPGPRLSWRQLDTYWRSGNKKLYTMYEKLYEKLKNKDVFVNWHGSNIHPEFIKQLSTLNAFVCNDDPESSKELSKPAAWAYDCCFVGNVAEVETYKYWGLKNVNFLPMGFSDQVVFPGITADTILKKPRKYDIIFFGERASPWRKTRLDRIAEAFPNGHFFGRGWPNGYIPKENRLEYYANAKIGINIHNSTGPINVRTYELPANGVLQICDNKSHLAQLFELDREVVGFDTIGECIDKVHYYLGHEDERRQIAARGWERAWRDYYYVKVWQRLETIVTLLWKGKKYPEISSNLKSQQRRAYLSKIPIRAYRLSRRIKRKIRTKITPPISIKREESTMDYNDIWCRYGKGQVKLDGRADYKIGILKGQAKKFEMYIHACQELDVRYAVIDLTANSWLEEIRLADCDAFLARPPHWISVWRNMYTERVQILVSTLGKVIFPSLHEILLYENKRMMAYWLKANSVPHPRTDIFCDKSEALIFARLSKYPIVYKTAIGSAGSGVRILRNFSEAENLITEAFEKGVVRDPGDKRDKQWGYVLFQEYIPNAREFRIIRIGDSYFGHEKLKKDGMHSGSNLARWGPPPRDCLDMCFEISEKGNFRSMDFDVLMTEDGRFLVSELQCVFGSYNPSQMYIDDTPGRYRRIGNDWVFEEGLFCRNGCANLRLVEFLKMLNSSERERTL